MKSLNVINTKDLGPLFVENPHRMIGQDGAFSIPMPSQTLWFFGDTLIGKRIPGESLWFPNGQPLPPENMSGKGTIQHMFCNTGLLVSHDGGVESVLNDYRYILDENGKLKTLIPLLQDEDKDKDRIWCQHGVFTDGKLYLSFIKVRMLPHGFLTGSDDGSKLLPVNFEIIGSGLVVGDPQTWTFKRLLKADDYIWWPKNAPHFGSCILKDSNHNRLYFYGVLMDSSGVQRCYVARVAVNDIEDYSKYEYLRSSKPEWSKNINDAMSIFSDAPSEVSVSYNHYLKRYLAVHSFMTSAKIVGRTALNPWGPWSEPVALYTVNVDDSVKLPYSCLIYAGKEHPELAEDNGKTIYITYIEFEEYYPHLIRVAFE